MYKGKRQQPVPCPDCRAVARRAPEGVCLCGEYHGYRCPNHPRGSTTAALPRRDIDRLPKSTFWDQAKQQPVENVDPNPTFLSIAHPDHPVNLRAESRSVRPRAEFVRPYRREPAWWNVVVPRERKRRG